jgi:hypothetical protein
MSRITGFGAYKGKPSKSDSDDEDNGNGKKANEFYAGASGCCCE